MEGVSEAAPRRLAYSEQDRMGLYRLLNRCSALIESGLSSDDWLIERHIALGNHENRPYDLTTLSDAVGMPRTTVSRRVATLVELGFYERVYQGRRATFRATERIEREVAPAVDEIIRLLRSYAAELEKRYPSHPAA